MKRRAVFQNTFKFALIAAATLLVAVNIPLPRKVPPPEKTATSSVMIKRVPTVIIPPDLLEDEGETRDKRMVEELPAWKRYALPFTPVPGKPQIAIVIDDLGEYPEGSKEAIALPGPLTLAVLPYPDDAAQLAAAGRTSGHEIMMHMPMEGSLEGLDKASYVMRRDMTPEELEKVYAKNLASFGGYVGINNHMGSRLTADPAAMAMVMTFLKERGLLFLDSRTTGATVAEKTAAAFGVPHAARNIFLDDDPSYEAVLASLKKTETYAQAHGRVIAIGHPKDETLRALREWLPTLKDKGFQLVPISAVVMVSPQG